MRYKFKAWNKKNKRWVTNKIGIWGGDIIIYDRDAGDDGILAFRHKTESCYPEKCWDEVEIVQYTGLKDRNGIEIYSGDILERYSALTAKGENPMIKSVVKFGKYGWEGINGFNVAEVIGSIWENPELLQEDK